MEKVSRLAIVLALAGMVIVLFSHSEALITIGSLMTLTAVIVIGAAAGWRK